MEFPKIKFDLLGARRVRIGYFCVAFAIAFSIYALFAFHQGDGSSGWVCHLLSVPLLMCGLFLLSADSTVAARLTAPGWRTSAALIVVLAIAAALRFFRLDTIPFGTWYDEADIGIVAQLFLRDSNFRPAFVGSHDHALHFFALVAGSFKLFGETTEAVRIVTAVFGTLTVLFAFLLGNEIRGLRFGLIFAFLVAVMRWHITFSRFAIYTVTLPFFQMLTLWLLFRARRTRRPFDFALAGLALGMGLNFHMAMRIFPAVVLGFMVFWFVELWRQDSHIAKHSKLVWASVLFFVSAALAAYAPVLDFAMRFPEF